MPAALDPAAAARDVRRQAQALWRDIDEPWQDYPVDVELIATLLFDLGIEKVPGLRLGGHEYAGLLQAEARLVAVEAEHHPHRQRFSVAHEVGHFVLHYRQDPSVSDFLCSAADMEVGAAQATAEVAAANRARALYYQREAEANRFAAELLMPAAAVRAMHRVTGGNLSRLTAHFDVSAQAMERRLGELGLRPAGRRP